MTIGINMVILTKVVNKSSFVKYWMFKLGSTVNVKFSSLAWARTESTKTCLGWACQIVWKLELVLDWLDLLVKPNLSSISSFWAWNPIQVHYQTHINHIIKFIWF